MIAKQWAEDLGVVAGIGWATILELILQFVEQCESKSSREMSEEYTGPFGRLHEMRLKAFLARELRADGRRWREARDGAEQIVSKVNALSQEEMESGLRDLRGVLEP